MNISSFTKVGITLALLVVLSSCANTIRGVGHDAANTVDATQSAGHSVSRAARR